MSKKEVKVIHNLSTLINLMKGGTPIQGLIEYAEAIREDLEDELDRIQPIIEAAVKEKNIRVWAYNGGRKMMIKEILGRSIE